MIPSFLSSLSLFIALSPFCWPTILTFFVCSPRTPLHFFKLGFFDQSRQPKMTMFPYKCVLVVGATSGIGRGLAEKIIGNGGKVIAVGRRQENLDELVRKHGENRVSGICFDITDLDGIPSFVDT